MCPECGGGDVAINPYDFGICQETGYRDAGERFVCRGCGAAGDASELVSQENVLAPWQSCCQTPNF
jgi:rubredoxin